MQSHDNGPERSRVEDLLRHCVEDLLGVLLDVKRGKQIASRFTIKELALLNDMQTEHRFTPCSVRLAALLCQFVNKWPVDPNAQGLFRFGHDPLFRKGTNWEPPMDGQYIPEILSFLEKPLDDMPLWIQSELWRGLLARWRLQIGK